MEVKDLNLSETELKIIEAAKDIFIKKGMEGARMQEIADAAGINKALLHYYFRSKEKLFEMIFKYVFSEVLRILFEVIDSDMGIEEKIRGFFDKHISFLKENPYLPGFVMHELARNPDLIVKNATNIKIDTIPHKFAEQVQKGIDNGEIKEINPKHLIVNMMSLSVFPFAAAPLIRTWMQIDENEYGKFLEERKTFLPEFVIASIKKY